MVDIAVITGFIERPGLLNLPECHGLSRLSLNDKPVLASLGPNCRKRNAIPEQKRAFRKSGAGPEHLVDRLDQSFRGTEIFPQRVCRTAGIPACGQIGMNIGAAKRINRLFGITDHQQRCIRIADGRRRMRGKMVPRTLIWPKVPGPCPFRCEINLTEDGILHGIGILKFVDQSCRELLADDPGQPPVFSPLQGIMQTAQKVVKTHQAAAVFFLPDASADVFGCMVEERRINLKRGQILDQLVKSRISRMFRDGFVPGGTRLQPGAGKFFQCFNIRQRSLVFDPGTHRFQPSAQGSGSVFVAVQGFISLSRHDPFDRNRKIRFPDPPGFFNHPKAFFDQHNRVVRRAQPLPE